MLSDAINADLRVVSLSLSEIVSESVIVLCQEGDLESVNMRFLIDIFINQVLILEDSVGPLVFWKILHIILELFQNLEVLALKSLLENSIVLQQFNWSRRIAINLLKSMRNPYSISFLIIINKPLLNSMVANLHHWGLHISLLFEVLVSGDFLAHLFLSCKLLFLLFRCSSQLLLLLLFNLLQAILFNQIREVFKSALHLTVDPGVIFPNAFLELIDVTKETTKESTALSSACKLWSRFFLFLLHLDIFFFALLHLLFFHSSSLLLLLFNLAH